MVNVTKITDYNLFSRKIGHLESLLLSFKDRLVQCSGQLCLNYLLHLNN